MCYCNLQCCCEVLLDVRLGYLTREAAWAQYGVRITEGLAVDEAASEPRWA